MWVLKLWLQNTTWLLISVNVETLQEPRRHLLLAEPSLATVCLKELQKIDKAGLTLFETMLVLFQQSFFFYVFHNFIYSLWLQLP